jgi:hypothetical protein
LAKQRTGSESIIGLREIFLKDRPNEMSQGDRFSSRGRELVRGKP